MKIAILHDNFRVLGGGEKLVLTLAKILGCDIITSEVCDEVIEKAEFNNINIITLEGMPLTSFFPPSALRKRFQDCDKHSEYDFFIFSGTHAVYAAKKHKPNIWYCHTPDRGIYGYGLQRKGEETSYESIITIKNKVTQKRILPSVFSEIGEHVFVFLPRIIANLFSTFYAQKEKSIIEFLGNIYNYLIFSFSLYGYRITKHADREAVSHIQKIVVNSKNIQKKVKKDYGIGSVIAFPPICCSSFRYEKNGDFWLSVNRIVPEKRIDMQISAFRNTPSEKLLIIGSYEKSGIFYADTLLKNLPDNVEFLGPVHEHALTDLYANCKGFITTAYDEDFGMTAVEAMASGKPVIAPNEGGYIETVIDGKTGILIDDIDDKKLQVAIKKMGVNPESYKDACVVQAKKFDTSVFIEKIKKVIGI